MWRLAARGLELRIAHVADQLDQLALRHRAADAIDLKKGQVVTCVVKQVVENGIEVVVNDRIQGFTPDGTPRWQWGHRGRSVEQLDAPSGLAIDATGALVIADANNHRIHRVGADDLRTSR